MVELCKNTAWWPYRASTSDFLLSKILCIMCSSILDAWAFGAPSQVSRLVGWSVVYFLKLLPTASTHPHIICDNLIMSWLFSNVIVTILYISFGIALPTNTPFHWQIPSWYFRFPELLYLTSFKQCCSTFQYLFHWQIPSWYFLSRELLYLIRFKQC